MRDAKNNGRAYESEYAEVERKAERVGALRWQNRVRILDRQQWSVARHAE